METKTITPTQDLVLCRAEGETDRRTAGGLHVPDTVRGRIDRATVVKVGPGGYTRKGVRKPMGVEVGQTVLFDPYALTWVAGTPLEAATPVARAGDLFLIREDGILGVVEPSA